jgi:hypothetical protein
MTSTTGVSILSNGIDAVAAAQFFDELQSALEEQDIKCVRTSTNIRGMKDDGLTLGLNIASLALSAVSTFVSVISFHLSSSPEYSVLVRRGEYAIKVKSMDHGKLEDAFKTVAGKDSKEPVTLEVEPN